MTAPGDVLTDDEYDYSVFPYLAPRSTASRLRHFTTGVFDVSPESHLYKFIDALCGDGGAGSLKKELLFARFSQQLDTIFFRDLDNIFGKIASLVRYASETYEYDPTSEQLTTDEWNEVKVKDAWYRQRIKDFMMACGLGGTPAGFQLMCRAALGIDCDLYEVTKYMDSDQYSQVASLGRTGISLRNEVVIRPYKAVITPKEKYLLDGLLEKIRPADTIVTIDPNGLAVHYPVTINKVAASSSYFEVEKKVTGIPDLAKLPPPEVLAPDLDPSNFWIKAGQTTTAPTIAFTSTQEASLYYLYSYGGPTAIDTVIYCEDTENVRKLHFDAFTFYPTPLGADWGPWTPWELADSPDNYPGGKNGRTPFEAPAQTTTGAAYNFPYTSQQDFVTKQTKVILQLGGQANAAQYRLPLTRQAELYKRTWDPTLAVPTTMPTTDSTVQTGWVRRPNTVAAYDQYQRQVFTQRAFVAGGI